MSRKGKTPPAPQRLTVTDYVPADTERLYGSWDKAIGYLQEMRSKYPTGTLEEHWLGYEDMEMRVSWTRPETDSEMAERLETERSKAEYAAAEAKRAEERRRDEAEFQRLKSKLGRL